MKRTEKAKPTGKANQRTATETRQRTMRSTSQRGKLQPASPEASKNRCRCSVAKGAEAWRSDHDHPKDRLQRGNRGVQEPEFHRAEGHRGDSRRGRRRNGDQLLLNGEKVRILGKTSTFFQLETDVRETNTDFGAQSAQQVKITAMSFDERKTFAATKEDLEHNTADIPVVMHQQVL